MRRTYFFAVVALALTGLFFAGWLFLRTDGRSAEQRSEIERVRADLARLQAALSAGKALPGDDRRARLLVDLSDGEFSVAEYERAVQDFARPFRLSDAQWQMVAGKFSSREEAERQLAPLHRQVEMDEIAQWFQRDMPAERTVRERFVDSLMNAVEHDEPKMAWSAFVALNGMGELARQPGLRDRAVAALQRRTEDAGVQEFISAWVKAEKVVREQREGVPGGQEAGR